MVCSLQVLKFSFLLAESETRKAPMYMQASSVLLQLEHFARKGSPLEKGKNSFKRPRSPHSTGTDAGPSGQQGKKLKQTSAASPFPAASDEPTLSAAQLKARLQAKLQAFRSMLLLT